MEGRRLVFCLMGPTASGKTDLGLQLARQFPLDIVSVDSAQIYRGMDIGTAKPDESTLRKTPHRLIDILEPEQIYSAGRFVRDACREIDAIHATERVPLLVGGTMMYFRSLIEGIADLPDADAETRRQIDAEAAESGWPAMHEVLSRIDPDAAGRISPYDRQRIQRALEVYRVSGKPLSELQADSLRRPGRYEFAKIALVDASRPQLHERINRRFRQMLKAGFLEEVRGLMRRPGLRRDSTSMRAVGYRQLWAHLEGQGDLDAAVTRAQAATRQLAKRQLTWLRADASLETFDPLEAQTSVAISSLVERKLDK